MSKTTLQDRLTRAETNQAKAKREAVEQASNQFDNVFDPFLIELNLINEEVEAAKEKGDLVAITAATTKIQAFVNRQQPVVMPKQASSSQHVTTPAPAAAPDQTPPPPPAGKSTSETDPQPPKGKIATLKEKLKKD